MFTKGSKGLQESPQTLDGLTSGQPSTLTDFTGALKVSVKFGIGSKISLKKAEKLEFNTISRKQTNWYRGPNRTEDQLNQNRRTGRVEIGTDTR